MTYKQPLAASAGLAVLLSLVGCGGNSDGVDSREQLAFNAAPTFSSTPNATANIHRPYSYTVSGADVDSSELSYSATELPHWLSFAGNELSGTPGSADIGSHSVTLTVSDGALITSQSFTVEVTLASDPGSWELVWSDEFDGTELNQANWGYQFGDGSEYGLIGWGNNELQWYEEDNVTVADGKLMITAEKGDGGRAYTSGRIRSLNKVDTKYGRIEARAKAPEGKGLWSAFWMLPSSEQYGGWASGGEIDIMEIVSPTADDQKAHGTIHYGMAWPLNSSSGGLVDTPVTDDYHVYAIEWERDEIRWYIDDVHYATASAANWWSYFYKNSTEGYSNPEGGAPFDQNFHMLLNLAVGGNWPGSPNDDTMFPATLSVDYVRVYQCSADTTTGIGCINNVNPEVDLPGAQSAYVNSQALYTDGPAPLQWMVGDEEVVRELKAGVAWDNGGAIVMTEQDMGGERGMVIDVMTSNMGNIAINAVDNGTFDLKGMGTSAEPWKLAAGELKFDMYVMDAHTTPGSAMLIKMDSGWPALGYRKLWPLHDLPHDQWFTVYQCR